MERRAAHPLGFSLVLLYLATCVPSHAKLYPVGETWTVGFDPPYDDSTVKVQLKIYDWWTNFQDKAVLPKGTEIPIIEDGCAAEVKTCRTWRVPGDIKFEFGPPTVQDTHRLNFFLTDTGVRVPIYGAAYESVSSSCTGREGAVCCGQSEYTLTREQVDHAAFKMWATRPNGTALRDGTVPNNYRSAAATLEVTSGFYSSSVSWPNYFSEKTGIPSDSTISSFTDLQMDTQASSFNDLILELINNYTLLLPTNDPTAPGFVVPTASFPEAAEPLDTASWARCRSNNCGAALGSCAPQNGPTPYPKMRGTTSATILEKNWAALGRGIPKTCQVLGTGRQAFVNPDFSNGPVHSVQYVSCDYQGTAIVPTVTFKRESIDAGNTSPPPRPPPARPPSPPPPSPPPDAVPATSTSPTEQSPPVDQASPSPPPSPKLRSPPPPVSFSQQGPAVAFIALLPAFSVDSFDVTVQAQYVKAIQKAAIGTSSTPIVRVRTVADPGILSGAGRKRRMLLKAGVEVDTVVDFAPGDTTAASAFLTTLQTNPSKVFPSSTYGAVSIPRAAELNCVTPCGPHGKPAPRVNPAGATSCMCECDPGWATAPNQSFESFKYCSLTTESPSPLSDGGSESTGGTSSGNSPTPHVLLFWRPPVPRNPPPAPVQYRDSQGLSAGDWVGIVVGVLAAVGLMVLLWKTSCCGFAGMLAASCVALWYKCVPKGRKTQDESEAEGEGEENTDQEKEKSSSKPKKKVKVQREEETEGEGDGGGEGEGGTDIEAGEASPKHKHKSPKKNKKKTKQFKGRNS